MPVPSGMAAVMAMILSVLFRQIAQGFTEYIRVRREGAGGKFAGLAGFWFETADTVKIRGVVFRGLVTLALAGQDVDQSGTGQGLGLLEHMDKVFEVVAVDGSGHS